MEISTEEKKAVLKALHYWLKTWPNEWGNTYIELFIEKLQIGQRIYTQEEVDNLTSSLAPDS